MARSTIKTLLIVAMLPLAGCSTFVEDWVSPAVATNLQGGLQNAQTNHQRNKGDDKKLSKEREKLKQQGKCPVCSGMGKSPDGLYTCDACKGTGKYSE